MEIDRENMGTFFPWEGEPEGSDNGVVIRLLTGEQQRELDDLTVTLQNVIIDGQLFKDRIVNEKLREKKRLEMCIVSWKGLKEKGVEIPCTEENKSGTFLKSRKMARFVDRCIEKLVRAELAEREAERKNG